MAQSQSQSTVPLAIAGTLAVHLLIAVVIDFVSIVWREEPKPERKKLGLVDIDTSRIPDPPPPPENEEPAPNDEPAPEIEQPEPQPRTLRTPRAARTTPTVTSDTPPTPTIDSPAGGAPVVTLPGIAPAARGVAAASGQPTRGRVGRGGTGGGSGSGVGDGSGSGPPVIATSVASIKTPAEAKEGFDYFDARKSYPAEARRLGIEGKLRVRLVVDATGKVSQAKLLGSLGHGLDELALNRARAIEFVPAKDSDDKPVASVVVWTFTFTLPSDT